MTSVMAIAGVMLFLGLKDVTNICKRMQHSPIIGGNYSVQWLNFKCVFVVYCVLELKKISSSA